MTDNTESNKLRMRKWRAKNKQHYRDYQREYRRKYRAAQKESNGEIKR